MNVSSNNSIVKCSWSFGINNKRIKQESRRRREPKQNAKKSANNLKNEIHVKESRLAMAVKISKKRHKELESIFIINKKSQRACSDSRREPKKLKRHLRNSLMTGLKTMSIKIFSPPSSLIG